MGAGVAMDRFDEPAVFYAQVRLCVCMREREREREGRGSEGGKFVFVAALTLNPKR
jgi:hypothetical protein